MIKTSAPYENARSVFIAQSKTAKTDEVVERQSDKKWSAKYEKLFSVECICRAIEKPYEQKCPIGVEEMIVRESAEGGIYRECGANFRFSMKNEPRWVCSQECGKYRKMREGDLKLEK